MTINDNKIIHTHIIVSMFSRVKNAMTYIYKHMPKYTLIRNKYLLARRTIETIDRVFRSACTNQGKKL